MLLKQDWQEDIYGMSLHFLYYLYLYYLKDIVIFIDKGELNKEKYRYYLYYLT